MLQADDPIQVLDTELPTVGHDPFMFEPLAAMSPSQSAPLYRIDTRHHLVEMMQAAIGRILRDQVDILLDDESILLTGSVTSWADKQLVQESIRTLSGTRVIDNQVDVCG